jgi:hypothetical protein
MAEPPKTPPSSDIDGVNMDARIGRPSKRTKPDPGKQLKQAADESIGRPDYDKPSGSGPRDGD